MPKYKFSNKTMFAIVMRDEAVCKEFIERLFPGRKVRDLQFPEQEKEILEDNSLGSLKNLIQSNLETEKSIINGIASKSVRLDVLFEDSDTLYNIEMQVCPEKYMAQRSRYYHSSMNVNSLKAGESYGTLKKSYVIFICMYDPFQKGEALYEFEMTDQKLDLQLNDGTYTIIVNIKCPKGKIPSELEPFYTYVDTGKVDKDDLLTRMIDERVEQVNDSEEASGVMTVEEEIKIQSEYAEERGFERGRSEGEQLGLERGAAQKQLEIAKKMLADGMEVANIAKFTGLSLADIEKL